MWEQNCQKIMEKENKKKSDRQSLRDDTSMRLESDSRELMRILSGTKDFLNFEILTKRFMFNASLTLHYFMLLFFSQSFLDYFVFGEELILKDENSCLLTREILENHIGKWNYSRRQFS